MDRKNLVGIVVSAIWVGGFALLLVLKLDSIAELSLNAWGDLFAGFAAPLALIWLIVGYRQQSDELRLNTRALEAQQQEFERNTEVLKAQQEELKNQVAATHVLAENTARLAKSTEQLLELEKLRLAGTVIGKMVDTNR